MGPELMGMFRSQAERFGATMVTRKVVKVDLSESPGETPHKLWIDDASTPEPTYTATAVIIATGAQSLMLGLPNESALVGHGLYLHLQLIILPEAFQYRVWMTGCQDRHPYRLLVWARLVIENTLSE